MKKLLFLIAIPLFFSCNNQTHTNEILVTNTAEFHTALQDIAPGTVITMKDGVWNNAVLKFHGYGTEQQPIILQPETAGGVTLEGQSVLKLSGEYLVAKDLYFKNGFTPDDAVIIYRNSPDSIAFNCRVTGTVIENYTQDDRHRKDHWVEFYGQYNELDHCYIAGKSNEGPTVKVYLNDNRHINNYHSIHDNYFGPRPRKGGPKAETMQLGASTTSMTPSYTQVTNNLFEKCNGEVEIISSKSNFNNFSNNVFLESEGSVVTRHGNYATINGNIFIANDNPYVGGVRVINTGHWITNNYFLGLKGKEFRSALAIMNGIPKSPLNRYNQVTDAVIAHNSWINCEQPIHMSVGVNLDQAEVLPPSEIRSARPERVIFANNFVYNDFSSSYPIKAYDKIDGVSFKNNLMISNQTINSDRQDFELKSITNFIGDAQFFAPSTMSASLYSGFGFDKIQTDLFGKSRKNDQNQVGAIIPPVSEKYQQISTDDYGPEWYASAKAKPQNKSIQVSNTVELLKAINESTDDGTILLNAGIYELDETITIDKPLTLSAEMTNGRSAVIIKSNASAAFTLLPYADLNLINLTFNGNSQQDFIITDQKNKMYANYSLALEGVTVGGFRTVLESSKGSFADEITIENSTFKDLENGFLLNKEVDDKGDYNVEFLTITNSSFDNISHQVIDFYRGGYDESTIGGVFNFKNNTVSNSGKMDDDQILINTRGIVNVTFENNNFTNNSTKLTAVLWGAKGQQPVNNTIIKSGEIKVVENIELKLVY